MRKFIKTSLMMLGALVKRDRRPKVIFYHDLGKDYTAMGTSVSVFQKHMKVVRRRLKLGGQEDLVCFDDGFRGAWDHRELLLPKTKIFIAVGLVGRKGYLTWEEMRVMQKEYAIDFQCHTWSHQTLIGPWNNEVAKAERTESWYQHELVSSKNKIEQELGKVVDELCFPVGYFSDEVVARCKEAGYSKVYASYPGNMTSEFIQPRCLVQDLSSNGLKAVLCGGMNYFANRYCQNHYIQG